MKRTHKYLLTCTAIALGMTTLGCETLVNGSPVKKKKKDSYSWSLFKKKEYQIPQSLNVTWAHDILTLPGKPPTRGFGGRFYFYNEKTQAIPVDGDLVVYGFDDTGKQKGTEDLSQADKRFRFTAEQFTTHFTEGELGASYSVWIPWDAAYGSQKKIMLIPTFMTKEGRLIRGAAASLNLPGKSNEDPNDGIIPPMTTSIPTVLPGQMFDARIPPNAEPKSGLRTTTIQVPTNMLMRKGESNDKLAESILQQTQQSVPPSNTNPAYATSVSYQEPNSQFANRQPLSGQPVSGQPGQGVSTISNGKGVFDSALPVMHSSFSTKNANGWALPEFAPATWSVQSPRSAPSQPQAPALQASPQVASPNR